MSDLFPGSWARDAACQNYDPDLWFPPPVPGNANPEVETERWAFARTVCNEDCPVQTECLEFAMQMERSRSSEMRAGMWGGFTPAERNANYRRRRDARRAG